MRVLLLFILRSLGLGLVFLGVGLFVWVGCHVLLASPGGMAEAFMSRGVVAGLAVIALGGGLFLVGWRIGARSRRRPGTRDVDTLVRRLVADGREVEAIRAYRTATGAGFDEAQAAVKQFQRAA